MGVSDAVSNICTCFSTFKSVHYGRADLLNELFSEGDNGRGAAALTRQVSGSVFDRWSVAKKGDEVKTETTARNAFDPPFPYLLEVEYFNTDECSRQLLTGSMELTRNMKIFKT